MTPALNDWVEPVLVLAPTGGDGRIASELLVEVFGDAGRHARSAFGVAQIPLGACVEIELIAEIA